MATLDALESVRISYDVPFPLTQLFTPTSLELRAEAFSFLLQLRYTRALLDQTRVALSHRAVEVPALSPEPAALHQAQLLRQKLASFIDGLYTWLTDRILVPLTIAHAQRLADLVGLGEMIQAELGHTRQMRDFCLAHDRMGETRRAVRGLMEVAQELWEAVVPAQRSSTGRAGGTAVQRTRINDSDSDEDPADQETEADDDGSEVAHVKGRSAENRLGQAAVLGMTAEVDHLTAEIRSGIHELVGEVGQRESSRQGWEMLSFALEGW